MSDKRIVMFGKSHGTAGDCTSHLCLCTAGDIKVKTPGRFVTIFKDGKLTADGSSEIFTVSSENEMRKKGVYIVKKQSEDGTQSCDVYVYADGEKILLASGEGGWLSYTVEQELKPEESSRALFNVGLYFPSMKDAKKSGIQNGLAYILDENKLYKVVNGVFYGLEDKVSDSPFEQPEQEEEEEEEELDQLKVGVFFIDGVSGIINAEGEWELQKDGISYLRFQSFIRLLKDILITGQADIHSEGFGTGQQGFSVYRDDDGLWCVETDRLIVHNESPYYIPSTNIVRVDSDAEDIILSATWTEPQKKAEFTVKYGGMFQEGDYVGFSSSGGNMVTVTVEQVTRCPDDGECETKWMMFVETEHLPEAETKIKVHYTLSYDDSEQNPSESKEKEVTIPNVKEPDPLAEGEEPAPEEEGEEEVGQQVEEDIDSDIKTQMEKGADVRIDSIEILEGDQDLYLSDPDSGTGVPVPVFAEGQVVSADPLTVEFHNFTGSLSGLQYMEISKTGSPDSLYGYTEYVAENITLWESDGSAGYQNEPAEEEAPAEPAAAEELPPEESGEGEPEEEKKPQGSSLKRVAHNKWGDISGLVPETADPAPAAEAEPEETPKKTAEYGFYTDNLVSVGGRFIGPAEEGGEPVYPTYHDSLKVPDAPDDSKYDNVVPCIAWVKKVSGTGGGGASLTWESLQSLLTQNSTQFQEFLKQQFTEHPDMFNELLKQYFDSQPDALDALIQQYFQTNTNVLTDALNNYLEKNPDALKQLITETLTKDTTVLWTAIQAACKVHQIWLTEGKIQAKDGFFKETGTS